MRKTAVGRACTAWLVSSSAPTGMSIFASLDAHSIHNARWAKPRGATVPSYLISLRALPRVSCYFSGFEAFPNVLPPACPLDTRDADSFPTSLHQPWPLEALGGRGRGEALCAGGAEQAMFWLYLAMAFPPGAAFTEDAREEGLGRSEQGPGH